VWQGEENRHLGLLSLEECEAYVAKVWSRVWDAGFPTKGRSSTPPTVKDGRGTRCAYSYGGEIGLPRWARKEWVILHELAHELTANKFAAHGPEFVACYLRLVEIFLGFEQRQKLGAEFLKRNVKTRP
jgi:putative metallohydrolase (TIGR04338 family)